MYFCLVAEHAVEHLRHVVKHAVEYGFVNANGRAVESMLLLSKTCCLAHVVDNMESPL